MSCSGAKLFTDDPAAHSLDCARTGRIHCDQCNSIAGANPLPARSASGDMLRRLPIPSSTAVHLSFLAALLILSFVGYTLYRTVAQS